jgi:hypothetical protein
MTRGQHLAYAISYALTGAATIVRGMWRTLTDEERRAVARRTVDKLREHGDQWKLDEEVKVDPLKGAHSSPQNFTQVHEHKKD